MRYLPRRGLITRSALLFRAGAAMAILLVAGGCARARSEPAVPAARELLSRIEASAEPKSFEFDHRAGGTRVNDCVLPNRRFVGVVDGRRGVLTVRASTGDGALLVLSAADAVILHRSLFGGEPLPAEWLRLPRDDNAEVEVALRRVLGAELSPYVLSDGLPASGRATAVDVLRVAKSVSALGPTMLGATRTEQFRVEVDSDRYAEALAREADAAVTEDDVPEPVVDLWVAENGDVLRVGVRPGATDDDGEPLPGWTVDYRAVEQANAVDVQSGIVELSADEIAQLPPPRRATCELPL